MPTGTVKWFNNAKGYGFILPDQGGEDLFAHYTSIVMDGYKTLKAGQTVTFEVVKGGKGLHATNIQTAEQADSSGQAQPSAGGASATAESSDGQTEEKPQAPSPASSDSEAEAYS